MTKLIYTASACIVLLVAFVSAARRNEFIPDPSASRPADDKILALATVVDTKIDDFQVCTLRVTHVYRGPATVQGKTFTAEAPNPNVIGGTTSPGGMLDQPQSVGDKSIWLLQDAESGLCKAQGDSVDQYGLRWPVCQRDGGSRFENCKALAGAVESTGKLKPEAQLEAWKTLVASPVPEISRWAVLSLVDTDPAGNEKFLHGLLINPKIAVAGRLAVDNWLVDTNEKAWANSAERLELLEGLVKQKLNEDDGKLLYSHLDLIAQAQANSYTTKIPQAKFLAILTLGVANRETPRSASNALRVICRLAEQEAYRTTCFATMFDLVQHSPLADVRQETVEYLISCIKLNGQEIAEIQAARQAAKDEASKRLLDQLLAGPPKN